MKRIVLLSVVMLLGCANRVVYELAGGTPPGWVVVEIQPACPSASMVGASRLYTVPVSRYACTSTAPPNSLSIWDYYTFDSNGRRVRIDAKNEIHQRIHIKSGTVNGVATPCSYDADAFWYGSADQLHGSAVEVIWANRPECRPQ